MTKSLNIECDTWIVWIVLYESVLSGCVLSSTSNVYYVKSNYISSFNFQGVLIVIIPLEYTASLANLSQSLGHETQGR